MTPQTTGLGRKKDSQGYSPKKGRDVLPLGSSDSLSSKEAALKQLDSAKWTWSHWRAILVAGTGFLTDSYDNFVIGLMVPMIAYVYYPGSKGHLPPIDDGVVKAASAYGNLIGQFVFGIMGDIFGRKKMYGVELIILVVGALGSALVGAPIRGVPFIAILAFWRFVLGIGVGGDYPVSGVITSEFAAVRNRGTMIALVFAMQGLGILLGALVAVITLVAFKEAIEADVFMLDHCWRILAGFGVVPALAAVYYRMQIPETPRFTIDVKGDVSKGVENAKMYLDGTRPPVMNASDPSPAASSSEPSVIVSPLPPALTNGNPDVSMESRASSITTTAPNQQYSFKDRFFMHFGKWSNLKILIATSMCWFLLDIGYYGTNLNTSVVLSAIGYADQSTPFKHVWTEAFGSLIIALAGNVPGYFFTVAFVDRWGRKPIQFMGFIMLFICFTILSAGYYWLKSEAMPVFVVVYAIAQFFFNFGPNATTFIIPAEVFPTYVRSTGHGISAAAGKLGAILAAQAFAKLADIGGPQAWMPGVLAIFAATCLGGFLFTFWIPETNGLSLEEISGEDRTSRE